MGSTDAWNTIEVSIDGPVAHLRFDRPDQNNSVTVEMVDEVYASLTALADSDTVAVVVLTGNGRAFCPGADLRLSQGDDATSALPALEAYQSARLLHEMPQVTLAAVNGGCAGAGIAWASACDLRVASSRARFSTAFLDVGMAGELGLSWTLLRNVGGAWARDISFLPRKLTAEEALAIGFVSRVFPDTTFAADVDAVVAELASRSLPALRDLKANFLDAERLDLATYIELESVRHQTNFRSS
ncbi:MAG: putative enoyl-CoA hydratase/isomerase [Actinomycetia bacterium]|nr:putative enoyl-CoA hydratase/isomerase [Actinomycetes bacterium]